MKRVLNWLAVEVLLVLVASCAPPVALVPPGYQVLYRANGAVSGWPPVDERHYSDGELATVKGNPYDMRKANYAFSGWTTSLDPLGPLLEPGTTIQVAKPGVTLYAVWTAQFRITYHANGAPTGVPPLDANPYLPTATVNVMGNTGGLARNGYTFTSWNTQADGSGLTYHVDQALALESANVDLYAQWAGLAKARLEVFPATAPGTSRFQGVSALSDGGTVVVGTIGASGQYNFGGDWNMEGPGKYENLFIGKFDASSKPVWLRSLSPGVGSQSSSYSRTAVDRSGAIYAVGYIYGNETYSFGDGVSVTATGWFCPILVKYSSSGSVEWAKTSDAPGQFGGIAIDADSNLYVTGWIAYKTPHNFGNGVVVSGSNPDGANHLLVKYDQFGVAQWARTLTSAGAGSSIYRDVAVDSQGNVYAVGDMVGTGAHDFGSGVVVDGATSSCVLVKYSSDGTTLWARSSGRPGDGSTLSSIAIDSLDRLVVSGNLESGNSLYSFGNGKSVTTNPGYNTTGVLLGYDTDGLAQWAVIQAGEDTAIRQLRIDGSGNIYTVGQLVGRSIDIGNGVTAKTKGYIVSSVAKYDPLGTAIWVDLTEWTSNSTSFSGLAVDQGGRVYAAGALYGTGSYDYGDGVVVSGKNEGFTPILLSYSE